MAMNVKTEPVANQQMQQSFPTNHPTLLLSNLAKLTKILNRPIRRYSRRRLKCVCYVLSVGQIVGEPYL